jgi:hypothetical protein
MKKNHKVLTAFILTLMMVMSLPIAAFATDSTGSIEGNSDVTNVVLNVIVPTSLDFALDPLGLNTTGDNQVSTQDYFFVNQTLAPVKVALDINVTTSNGAVLTKDVSKLKKDDTSATDKKLYFGTLGATGLTGEAITTTDTAISYSAIFGSTTGPAAEYSEVTSSAATLVPFTPNTAGTTGAAVISFALDKAVESTTSPGSIESLAADNKGIAAFQFYSELNTYADWKDNDVTVSGSYTLTPLRTSTYSNFDFVDGGLNQLVATASTPTYSSAGFIVSGSAVSTLSTPVESVSSSAVNLTIPFYANGLTVKTLVITSSSNYAVPTGEYTLADNVLTIKKDDSNYTFRKTAVGNKSMTLTLSDNSTYTFTITQK